MTQNSFSTYPKIPNSNYSKFIDFSNFSLTSIPLRGTFLYSCQPPGPCTSFGLLVAMGVAFALTSLDPLLASGPFGLEIPAYTKAVAQLALGALALGVFVSGPGAVAIDHSIFGSSRSRDPFDDDDEDD